MQAPVVFRKQDRKQEASQIPNESFGSVNSLGRKRM